MSEEKNIPEDEPKDNSSQPEENPLSTGENTEPLTDAELQTLPAGQAGPKLQTPGEETTDNSSQSADKNNEPTEESTEPLTAAELQTTNYKLQTPSMEVHHPHHLTHKKKWTEYLLEFLMLFLAVFLGFVAENIRENYVERHREKEYIQSEITDLKADTAEFRRIISRYQLAVLQMDTLITLLHSPDKNAYLNDIYFLGRVSSFTPRFTYNEGTIQQLKNAGGLRLIKHKGVPDSIMNYDARVNQIKSQGEVLAQASRDYRNQANKIFDPYIFYQILKGTFVSAQRPLNSPPLLSYDPEKINDVISQVMYLRSIFLVTLEMCKSTSTLATRLIALLQKEYHVD